MKKFRFVIFFLFLSSASHGISFGDGVPPLSKADPSITVPNSAAPARNQISGQSAVEKKRNEAISSAMVRINPSLAADDAAKTERIEGTLGPDEWINIEVERLRKERKEQFKLLTWSHIKSTINPDTIRMKESFLKNRNKNLGAVLERAEAVYLPAQVSKERIRLAKFRIAKAIRDLFPEASIDANIRSGTLSRQSFLGDQWRMIFRQPLFRGGVLWQTVLLEWANLEIAKREYDQAIGDLIADVSKAYFEFERTENVLQDQKELFEKMKQQKVISEEKHKAKLISEIEKLNTDSLYSQSEYDMETARQELEIARLELQKFLKLEKEDQIEISSLYDLKDFNLSRLRSESKLPGASETGEDTSGLDHLVDLAYEHRPDLAVEASKLKGAQLAYRVSLGRRLPQIDMLLEFGELAEAFEEDLDSKRRPPHRHEFRLGFEVNWPILANTFKYTYDHDQRAPSVSQFLQGTGTRVRTNSLSFNLLNDLNQFASITEAKINSLEQVVELEKTEREVVREVKEAYFNFKKALIQVESTYKRMGYRVRLAELAKHRLEQNEIQISEYLQTEMDYTEERSLVYKALADYFLSKSQLNRAIGIRDFLSVETPASS